MSISVCVSESANYIYHILSVAKVGYDNDYGNIHKGLHKAQDLKVLKEHEDLIRVSGGEHCGRLYGLLVSKPACTCNFSELKYYYDMILDLLNWKDPYKVSSKYNRVDSISDFSHMTWLEELTFVYNAFCEDSKIILDLIEVFYNNIDVYRKEWDKNYQEIKTYSHLLFDKLDALKLNIKWDCVLKESLIEDFEVVLVNSIKDGPQAIDISSSKDVFDINQTIDEMISFISHEYGIYIIRQIVSDKIPFNMDNWLAIESLATYYNTIILEKETINFGENNKYLELYKKLDATHTLTEMLEEAIKI